MSVLNSNITWNKAQSNILQYNMTAVLIEVTKIEEVWSLRQQQIKMGAHGELEIQW